MTTLKKACVFVAAGLAVAFVQAGCGQQKQVAGIGNFSVDTSNGAINASVELTTFRTDTSLTVPVPKLASSFLQFGPAPDGKGSVLAFHAPFSSIAAAVGGALPQLGLPDGRALIGTSTSTLPGFDVSIGALSLRFYVSGDTFGVFIPLPNLPSFSESIEIPIQDPRGYVVAYAVAVPPGPKAGGGGVLVLFPVVASVSSALLHNCSLFS